VALDLPADVRAAIARWRDGAMAGRDDLRPVSADALHLTLCFLGWRREADAARIATLAFEACAGLSAPRLTPRGLEPIPARRPRLFALDLGDQDGLATELQAAVSQTLADAGHYEPEARPFWPHVTLARVKRGARAGALDAAPPPAEEFQAHELTLYRSTLRPQGAIYEPLAREMLPLR
jgi:2'-5' RNA ligase